VSAIIEGAVPERADIPEKQTLAMPEQRIDLTKDILDAVTSLLAAARDAAVEVESMDTMLHGRDGWRAVGASPLERDRHGRLMALRDRLAENVRETQTVLQNEFDKYALARSMAQTKRG
jgi:hypothetical protein